MLPRILFLLTQDLTSPSGLGRYLPLAIQLARRGHSVRIAALHSNFAALIQRSQVIQGVAVEYVGQMHVKKVDHLKIYFPAHQLAWLSAKATWELSKAALSTPADIIQICKPHPMNSIAGLLAKRLPRRRSIILDCDDYEAASNRFTHAWQQTGVRFFENAVPRWADLVTSNTHFTLDRLQAQGIPQERLAYIPNGVERSRFASIDAVEVERLRLSLDLRGKQVIVYVGSLSLPSHPVDLLLRAFALVQAHIHQARLLIVGGGEDLPTLKTLAAQLGIADTVQFVGRVAADAVPQYYRLGDVSVDPVYDDAAASGRAPLKMFESWAAGVPFVTQDVGDRRLFAGDPPAAYLAVAGSAESLAAGLQEVLCNQDLANQLRAQGYQAVKNYYWDRIVDTCAWIYQGEKRG